MLALLESGETPIGRASSFSRRHAVQFSLINVTAQSSDLVCGYWIEDHIGSLGSAREAARAIEAANSNTITVAVVAFVSSSRAQLSYWKDCNRLDGEV